MRKLAIMGSTGSIGTQTLEVVSRFPDKFKIIVLTADSNYLLLAEQARRFHPELIVINNRKYVKALENELIGTGVKILSGKDALIEAAIYNKVEYLVVSVVGFSGFRPTITALKAGKQVLLANKETLVVGGELIAKVIEAGAKPIWPIDSEHSAIWQCLRTGNKKEINRLILTASGGPFLGWNKKQLTNVTPSSALKHPNWNMGAKVTIDSATLMNKGLEVLEARWLFDIPLKQIDILIQPESVVHSLVEFVDGSIIAQMGTADMKIPIQYALTYPERWIAPESQKFAWNQYQKLTFMTPDPESFPCFNLACEAGRSGGTMPAVMSASDEIAVNAFLEKKLEFNQIPHIIETIMNKHKKLSNPDVTQLEEADQWARQETKGLIKQ